MAIGDNYGLKYPLNRADLDVLRNNPTMEIDGRRWCPHSSGFVKGTLTAPSGTLYVGSSVDTVLSDTTQGTLTLTMVTAGVDSGANRIYGICGWDKDGIFQTEIVNVLYADVTTAKTLTKSWGFLCMANPFIYLGNTLTLDTGGGTTILCSSASVLANATALANATPELQYHIPPRGILVLRHVKVANATATSEHVLTACAVVSYDLYTKAAKTEINIGAIAVSSSWNQLTYTVAPHIIYGGTMGKIVYMTATPTNDPVVSFEMDGDLFAAWKPDVVQQMENKMRGSSTLGRTGAQS